MKINRIRTSMIATLSFFIENVYNRYSFYWRNDTPSFVTWRSRLATAPDTPTCIVIHGGQFRVSTCCGFESPAGQLKNY